MFNVPGSMEYYDKIASGYDELHYDEQKKKLMIISNYLGIDTETRLLDIGCGTGFSSEFFNCQSTGLDPSRKMLIHGRNDGGNQRDLLQGEGEHLPFSDHTFDFVICVTAIHNFKDPGKCLREIKRVTKDSGAITILKKAQKAKMLQKLVSEEFRITKIVEEEKDHILFFKINPP